MKPLFSLTLLIALVVASMVGVANHGKWFQSLDWLIYDALQAHVAHRSAADDIVVVAIDEKSLQHLGSWPWPRDIHSKLVNSLSRAQARVIVFDVLFVDQHDDHPSGDIALSRAIENSRNVILPVHFETYFHGGQLLDVMPIFAEVAAGLGHAHILCEDDGICRAVALREGIGFPEWPHLAVVVNRFLSRQRAEADPQMDFDKEIVSAVPNVHLSSELHRSDYRLFPMVKREKLPHTVSYVDVLNNPGLSQLKGKVVFVGVTAAGLGDMLPTVSGTLPGVYIQSSIFDALRDNSLIVPLEGLALSLVLAGMALAFLMLASALGTRWFLIAICAGCLVCFAISAFMLVSLHIWWAPSALVFGMLIFYPALSWLRLEYAMRFLKKSVRSMAFVSGRVSHLLVNPQFKLANQIGLDGKSDFETVENVVEHLTKTYEFISYIWAILAKSVSNLNDGFVLCDERGQVIMQNERANLILGTDTINLKQGLNNVSDFHMEEGQHWPQFFAELVTHKKSQIGMASLVSSLHEDRTHILISAAPLEISVRNNVVKHGSLFLLVFTDITVLKNLEKSRLETLHFISHDLRTPMLSTMAKIEHFQMHQDGDSKSVLEDIYGNMQRNVQFVEDLLQLSKAENISSEAFSLCDLRSLVDEVYSDFKAQAKQKNIQLVHEVADQDFWVEGDAGLLKRVLDNLVANALKHTAGGGTVRIRMQLNEGYCLIQVQDNGCGIAEDQQSRLFDRYYKAGERANQGVGLGLYFVKKVLTKHKGSIDVTSVSHEGSTFSVSLPCLDLSDNE